jgi:Flp pilus assembly protein TadD
MALSQAHLNSAVSAFERRDCRHAVGEALAANSALSARPEPFEVLGYCDARLGRPRLGVTMFESAVRRDPDNWELHYGLALTRAAAGLDPRPEARRTLKLNPREPRARRALAGFRHGHRAAWRRQAARSPIPIR